ncbi:zinc finger protein 239-like isoform X1 [Trichogramma pretiosum]|uniref:zinc finger protein 239-like isoform X1 n=2 Tax=Trichogramma pretiosum TaxID=7493 RepID=UPI0006C9481C|nr:zinc finger protein 239-like isoform X1 [Trichogramma pretiosum]
MSIELMNIRKRGRVFTDKVNESVDVAKKRKINDVADIPVISCHNEVYPQVLDDVENWLKNLEPKCSSELSVKDVGQVGMEKFLNELYPELVQNPTEPISIDYEDNEYNYLEEEKQKRPVEQQYKPNLNKTLVGVENTNRSIIKSPRVDSQSIQKTSNHTINITHNRRLKIENQKNNKLSHASSVNFGSKQLKSKIDSQSKSKLQPKQIKKPTSEKKKPLIKDHQNISVTKSSKEDHSLVLKFAVGQEKTKNNTTNKPTKKVTSQSNKIPIAAIDSKKIHKMSSLVNQEDIIDEALLSVGITDEILKHKKDSENIKLWYCHKNFCGKEFYKLCQLKSHLLEHYEIKPFKCNYQGCSSSFYLAHKLYRHQKIHKPSTKKKFVCTIDNCNRSFTTYSILKTHEKSHLRPYAFSCDMPGCTEKFQLARDLRKHTNEFHSKDEAEAMFTCDTENCGKKFGTIGAYKAHCITHSYSKSDLTCSWPKCGKEFKQPCKLRAHMKIHNKEKNYVCNFEGCNKSFITSNKLNRHKASHTQERTFVCSIQDCGKAYIRKDHLKDHERNHKKDPLFTCEICSLAFLANDKLQDHIKIHNNHCNERALQENEKDNQVRIQKKPLTTQKKYECAYKNCGKRYKLKKTLRVHIKLKHSDSESSSDLNNESDTPNVIIAHVLEDNSNINENSSLGDVIHVSLEDGSELLTPTKDSANKGSARTELTRSIIQNMKSRSNYVTSGKPSNMIDIEFPSLPNSEHAESNSSPVSFEVDADS